MSNTVTALIPIGYSGLVTGLSRAEYKQRVIVKFYDAKNEEIFGSILTGSGENQPLKEQVNQDSTGITYGPFDFEATVRITIEHSTNGSSFTPSKVIAPITVSKAPTAKHPTSIRVTTILSEDASDNDFNDAIITIFGFQ